MELLIRLVTEYGLWFVFANVLLLQLGVPLPAYPVLMVTGALASRGQQSLPALLGVAVLACLIADSVWYLIGQWQGRRVLGVLCRISLSPDGCVRQTESIFTRFGPASLTVAKFVPGFATVATAMAGALRIRRVPFMLFDAVGATLWASVGLALGWLFSSAIAGISSALAQLGRWGLLLVLLAAAAFVARRWWTRHRFNQQLKMNRLTASALADLVDGGEPPLIVDVRSELARADGVIPGAIAISEGALEPRLSAHPRDKLIVVYCACPNDASAVLAARRLLERGYLDVRPLQGGIDAWLAHGRLLASSDVATMAPTESVALPT